jgi:hypothetical protein
VLVDGWLFFACHPDPSRTADLVLPGIGGIAIPSTINRQSSAFRAAQNACQGLLSARLSQQDKPPIANSDKAALVAHAQCMRTRGVLNDPDPRRQRPVTRLQANRAHM